MTVTVAMVALPDFNMMATVALLDPFRAANYLSGAALYRWTLASPDGGGLPASNGLVLPTEPLAALAGEPPDIAVVSCSWTPERHYGKRSLLATLRGWARRGVVLGGLDTGAFVLAHAGLLAGRRVTVHYEHIESFTELHPDLVVTDSLLEVDRDRFTCCGGVAAVDAALHLIRGRHGDALANAAAHYIFHDRLRAAGDRQGPSPQEPIGGSAPATLRAAIRLMHANLEEPLPVPAVARAAGISQRHLERLFRRHVTVSAVRYYRDIRLDRGRSLVTQTDMSVLEIALACGFSGAEPFARAYRQRFRLSPRQDRVAGRIPFEYRAWPMHPGRAPTG